MAHTQVEDIPFKSSEHSLLEFDNKLPVEQSLACTSWGYIGWGYFAFCGSSARAVEFLQRCAARV